MWEMGVEPCGDPMTPFPLRQQLREDLRAMIPKLLHRVEVGWRVPFVILEVFAIACQSRHLGRELGSCPWRGVLSQAETLPAAFYTSTPGRSEDLIACQFLDSTEFLIAATE